MYSVERGTELVSKGLPVALGALRPGDYVTISNARPVIYRDGQYVVPAQN